MTECFSRIYENCVDDNCFWELPAERCRPIPIKWDLPEHIPDVIPTPTPTPGRPRPTPNPSPTLRPRANTTITNVTGTLDEISGLSPEDYNRNSNFRRVGRNREDVEIITDIPFITREDKYSLFAIFGILFVIFLLALSCYFGGPPCKY